MNELFQFEKKDFKREKTKDNIEERNIYLKTNEPKRQI